MATVLVVLGLGGYLGTRRVSVTALIPAFFGLPILILGLVALSEAATRPAIIAATVVAILGFCGAARGLPKLVRMLTGATIERPIAAVMQSVMAVLCLAYAAWAIGWLQAALANVTGSSEIPDAIERSRNKLQAEQDVRASEEILAQQARGQRDFRDTATGSCGGDGSRSPCPSG